MYKVVIIDDEPIIVEGISKVIPWETYGCKLVATANDGMEGIKVIQEQNPDIIFTDIAMPGMNGLQMIAAIKVEHPDTMIAILTGYRDFDFAQTAIRLGVTRFLLKPSNLSELEEAIQTMVDTLKKKKPQTEPDEATDHSAGSFVVNNAVKYMEEHYIEKITLSDLADKMYVSQWHLSKLLNKHTKKSFSELLNEIRIKEAKVLLRNPALRIGDVADMVGFLDIAHFSRVFKQYAGMSANAYRNKKI